MLKWGGGIERESGQLNLQPQPSHSSDAFRAAVDDSQATMDLDSLPFSEPVASTSRVRPSPSPSTCSALTRSLSLQAVVTLSYKPAEDAEEQADAFDGTRSSSFAPSTLNDPLPLQSCPVSSCTSARGLPATLRSRSVRSCLIARNLAHLFFLQSTLSSLHDASLDQIVAFVHAASEGANSLYSVLSARVPLRAGLVIGSSRSLSLYLPFCAR